MINHYEEPKLNLINSIYISLFCLILFGFYKNGIKIYNGNYFLLFKPLILTISSFLMGYVLDKLFKQKKKYSLYALLISVCMPPQISFVIFLPSLLIWLILNHYLSLKINPIICYLFLFLIFLKPSFFNSLEANSVHFYGIIDTFLGFNVGGICITSIIIMILSYFYFSTKFYYKKEIPVIAYFTYLISSCLFDILTSNSNLLINLLNSHIFFLLIYILPLNQYSPIKKKNQYLYALISGLLIFVCTRFYNPLIGPFIAVFLINLFITINKFCRKKRNDFSFFKKLLK